MLKGLYAAASAMISGVNRQAVLTHNITNLNTAGFKQVLLTMEDWKKTQVSEVTNTSLKTNYPPIFPTLAVQGTTSLGEIGLGVLNPPETYDFSQGALQTTNQPLDMAIQGDGFFKVRTPNGDRYTRDGRFHLDSNHNLVTVDSFFVLDKSGTPIIVPDGDVTLKSDGTIIAGTVSVAQLSLTSFANPRIDLVRDENMFIAVGTPLASTSQVNSGVLESSNADLTQAMAQMLTIARSYDAAQQMVTIQDTLLGKSITSLGRFT
jgi:flagellar basal-body rod protein FlgF